MSYIDLRALKNLVHMIEGQAGLQQTLLTFTRNYNFRVNLRMIDYDMLLHIAQRINHRHKRNKSSSKHQEGKFGNSELKLFSWAVLLYCHNQKKHLPELLDDDLGKINHIFRRVEPDRIAYEIISFHAPKNQRSWTQAEIQLFLTLVREKQASEWKTIAYRMFTLSKRQYFRFFEEYREKWINYLNPNLEKGAWATHEEIKMMTLIVEMGHKWALISRHFEGIRNEHSIKNRYKKIVRSVLGVERCKDKENKAVDEQLLSYLIKKGNTERGSTETAKKEQIETVRQSVGRIAYSDDGRVKQEPKDNRIGNCIVAKQQNDSNGYIFFPPQIEVSVVKEQECQLKYSTN